VDGKSKHQYTESYLLLITDTYRAFNTAQYNRPVTTKSAAKNLMHSGRESTEKSIRFLSIHTILFWQTILLSVPLHAQMFLLFPTSNFHTIVFFYILQLLSPIKAKSTEAPRFSWKQAIETQCEEKAEIHAYGAQFCKFHIEYLVSF